MVVDSIRQILKNREFVNIATCDFAGHPNAAAKFLLKFEDHCFYLIDHSFGRTMSNLKINPKASLSFVNLETLTGYQVNGDVEIIPEGPEFEKITSELRKKQVTLSVDRIIAGISKGSRKSKKFQKRYEVEMPEKFVVLKVKAEEVIEVGPCGRIKRYNPKDIL
ncbi:MAG TPA: pyridoxamine 5'-phosphate oxidase family protein [Candidatus Omnitrophota bacterium]|nr:pyridoxamine 5'-phosphate oxidase family protein [Candidatus Omnitrophota bacterium]